MNDRLNTETGRGPAAATDAQVVAVTAVGQSRIKNRQKLSRATSSGFAWSLATQFGSQFVRLATLLTLAKFYLSPEDFGLVNMFIVFTGFAQILIDCGFPQALVQKKQVTQEDLSSVFWVNVAVCLLVTVGLMVFANRIAAFYRSADLTAIVFALSPIYVLNGLVSVQKVILKKEMLFRAISTYELIANFGAGVLACAAAVMGFGVWSLVAYYLTIPLLTLVCYWIAPGSWRPSFLFSYRSVIGISGFSLPLLGSSSLDYWARNIDKVLVGRILGEQQLGLYSQSYGLVLIPVTNFANTFVNVMFPAFSNLQDDLAHVARILTKVSKTVLAINLPVFMLLSICADDLIRVLLGPHWIEMSATLRIFAFVGLFLSLRTIHSSVFMSQNKNALLFKHNLIYRPVTALGFFVFVPMGTTVAAYWLLAAVAIGFMTTSYLSCRILQASFAEFLAKHVKLVFSGCLAMFVSHFGLAYVSGDTQASLIRMVVAIVIFLAAYVVSLKLLREEIIDTILRQLASRFPLHRIRGKENP